MDTKDLLMKRANAWTEFASARKEDVFAFSDEYRQYLDASKTERECVKTSIAELEKAGFQSLDCVDELKAGDKVYKDVRGKGLIAAVIGKKPMIEGMNILGAHIDSPRVDLKPAPLYEDSELAYLKTHYYGGIKKYQWATIPMAIHGVIYNQNHEKIEISIGEKEDDPVFTISEILIHLSQEQLQRVGNEVVKAEELNVLIGSIPLSEEEADGVKETVKAAVLRYLYDEYQITEKDFMCAELEVVPAFHAKDVGFDRSMIGSYGQDDRVCGYTSLRALMDIDAPEKTCLCILTDKEEIGSVGNTGAQSRSYENVMRRLMAKQAAGYNELDFVTCIENSKMLSSDVAAGFEPSFPSAFEKNNSAYVGRGVCLMKYTGSRGKHSANDANAEFFHEVVKSFDEQGIIWQAGELGRVDLGGGGTIAAYMAVLGMQVLDCGIPVLSMHAPLEVTSKADVYVAYEGYKVFLKTM